jgi:chromosome segregation ATPase
VSARVAAAQRRESPLNPASNSTANIEAEEAARAETLAVLDDLKERLARAEGSAEQFQRQAEVLQSRLDESQSEHAKLEEKVHEQDEQLEALRNEARDAQRQIQQMETIYEGERSAMAKEKDAMSNREEELQAVIRRLKDSLAQRADDEGRPSRQCKLICRSFPKRKHRVLMMCTSKQQLS